MTHLVDTNVLVRFIARGDAAHGTMRDAVEALRADGHALCVTPQNLI